jgi:hypothetical protein
MDLSMIEMVLPMIEETFLPVIGILNLTSLKFEELFTGSIKSNFSDNIPSGFSNNITNNFTKMSEKENVVNTKEEDKGNKNSLLSSMMGLIGDVWKKDYNEIQEEENLDDFLINDEKKTDNIKEDNIKEELVNDKIIDKNLILCNFELKIDDYKDLINKISEKDPEELFNLGKVNLMENYLKGYLNGIDKVELFGENDSCLRVIMENNNKEYSYNREDIVEVKKFMLKIINYIGDDDYILE